MKTTNLILAAAVALTLSVAVHAPAHATSPQAADRAVEQSTRTGNDVAGPVGGFFSRVGTWVVTLPLRLLPNEAPKPKAAPQVTPRPVAVAPARAKANPKAKYPTRPVR